MSQIYDEIVKRELRDGQDSQIFLKRMAVAIAELSDEEWNALPTAVQRWHGDAVDAINAMGREPLPPLPLYAGTIH